MSIDISNIKPGDTVTARFGKWTISGPVRENIFAGNSSLYMARWSLTEASEILDHVPAKPAWHDALVVRVDGKLFGKERTADYPWIELNANGPWRSDAELARLGPVTIIIDKDGRVLRHPPTYAEGGYVSGPGAARNDALRAAGIGAHQ